MSKNSLITELEEKVIDLEKENALYKEALDGADKFITELNDSLRNYKILLQSLGKIKH